MKQGFTRILMDGRVQRTSLEHHNMPTDHTNSISTSMIRPLPPLHSPDTVFCSP